MNIYIDESGSINKYATNDQYFVVSMIHVLDPVALERAYKRFISSNYEMLLDLDSDKVDDMTGKIGAVNRSASESSYPSVIE